MNKTVRNNSAVVGTGWSDILECVTDIYAVLVAEIDNTGLAAFTDFQVVAKTHQSGDWYTYQDSGITYFTNEPYLLASGATSRIEIDVAGFYAIKLQAKSSGTTADVFGNMSEAQGRVSSRVDTSTGAVCIVDYNHCEIHEGNHYKAGYQDSAMDADDVINLLLVTPDSAAWSHFQLVSQSTGLATVEFFEGTTVSGNGTPVTVFNRNRNSANVSTVSVYHTPSITGDGTKLVEKWIGSTGFRTNIGDEKRGDNEFVLKQNTKYLIRMTANANGIKGAIGGDWYEHENA